MNIASTPLEVTIAPIEDGVELKSEAGTIRVRSDHPERSNSPDDADFAAWYFLPVAMRLKRNLHINGRGSAATVRNFRRLSQIWQSWLPGHFSQVRASFSEPTSQRIEAERSGNDLLFFSGGLDAAYCALTRLQNGHKQDLLTIHGMDYDLQDQKRFDAMIAKTDEFAKSISSTRIVVRSDVYHLYDRFAVNLDGHHLGHIFSLAGAGFFHSKFYANLVLAVDEPTAGQFLVFPWGSNSATNRLFDNGLTRIVEGSQEIDRWQKLQLVMSSQLAANSLSFCWNREIQPDNCGRCAKCMRTKLLAVAGCGSVPEIFLDAKVPAHWADNFNFRQRPGIHVLREILDLAHENKTAHLIPGIENLERDIARHYRRVRTVERLRSLLFHRTGLSHFANVVRNRFHF